MKLSLTPLLLAVELVFVLLLFRNSRGSRSSRRLTWFWLWIVAYSILVSYLGFLGVYVSDGMLASLPALWLQLVTIAACVLPLVASRRLRDDLRTAVDGTSRAFVIRFQILRVAALGTLIGAAKGSFPAYFEWFVGVPDLLFALSSIWVLRRERTGRLSDVQFLRWNVVGVLVLVPSAPILLQLGLPGPLQLFTGSPDARAVFTYPMAIAPMIGVPLFVLVHLLVMWRLRERRAEFRFQSEASQTIPCSV